MRRNLLFSIIIVLLILLAYSNSFEASFHHDDVHVIVRNSHVKDLNNIPQFFLQPQMGSGVYTETSGYRPLLMATFAMNFYLGGIECLRVPSRQFWASCYAAPSWCILSFFISSVSPAFPLKEIRFAIP